MPQFFCVRLVRGVAGRGLGKLFRVGTCYEYRHQVDEECCRRGGVAGAEPRTREGRIGPTDQLQWLVASSQWSEGTTFVAELIGEWLWFGCCLR